MEFFAVFKFLPILKYWVRVIKAIERGLSPWKPLATCIYGDALNVFCKHGTRPSTERNTAFILHSFLVSRLRGEPQSTRVSLDFVLKIVFVFVGSSGALVFFNVT